MEFSFSLLVFFSLISLLFIAVLIVGIRYAIDSSKAALKLDDLTHEVRMLRNELKQIEKKDKYEKEGNIPTIDKRV